MKNKIRKVAKYCLDNPYEIAFYAMSGVAIGALVLLDREQRKHQMCHSMARWTALNVKMVPEGTKQHIWKSGNYYFIEAIKD